MIDITDMDGWVKADHGGGDISDFLSLMRGDTAYSTSGVTSCIEDSLPGHRIAYAADVAMERRRMIELI